MPERVGRCPSCAAFTYDVDGLSEEAVRRLVLETEGRVLTRLVQRADGRSMSVDCGHGTVQPPPRRARRVVVLGLLGVGLLAAGVMLLRQPHPTAVAEVPPPVESRAAPPGAPEQPPSPPVDAPAPPEAPVQVLVPAPDVHLADVSAHWDTPGVELSEIVGSLEAQLEPMRRCYLERMKLDPNYRGTVTTRLTVDRDGSVSRVSLPPQTNRRVDPRLEACVETALKAMRFATKQAGSVSFRLVFAGMI